METFRGIPIYLTSAFTITPVMDTSEPPQRLSNPREVDAFFYDDDNSSSGDSTVSSSSAQVQPPATTDIALMSPPPENTNQLSPAVQPLPTPAPGPDSDEDDEEIPDLFIPALIAPTMFLPIPNVRFSCFLKPVLIWWLSKDVLSDSCILRPILCLRY